MDNERRRQQLRRNQAKTKKKLLIYIIGFIFVVLIYIFLSFSGDHTEQIPQQEATLRSSSLDFTKDGELTISDRSRNEIVTIDVEIVEDSRSLSQGLMYRESMEEHQGMLFIFHPVDQPQERSMWMKNTIIPLDMIFIRQNRTIAHIAENTVPFDESSIHSEEPVSYVLEVNAGFAEKYGIQTNYLVSWR